ncbi:MAG: hypothetical protein AAF711_02790 [Planctomycetota bacterium]
MTKAAPKAWLCKHCGERVDPTMAWCWSCGRDKLGELQQDVSVDLAAELPVPVGGADLLNRQLTRRGMLMRTFLLSWCFTGLTVMVAGSGAITDRFRFDYKTPDYLAVIGFYFSVFMTFALIADRLFFEPNATSQDASASRSEEPYQPWIRAWMTRRWGRYLFWFAWVWLLLNYL